MNTAVLNFFRNNYVPGRICLVETNDIMGKLIRDAQGELTTDKKPSKWSHVFVMGSQRDDGMNDGSIYIFESDLHVSPVEFQVINGPQESRLVKWCRDSVEHACVLGIAMTDEEQKAVLRKGLGLADDDRMEYPVLELFGTLWAMLTNHLREKNIFNDRYAIQCATFARECYRAANKDPLPRSDASLSNTSPEKIYQSTLFTFRTEWHG